VTQRGFHGGFNLFASCLMAMDVVIGVDLNFHSESRKESASAMRSVESQPQEAESRFSFKRDQTAASSSIQ
jgi:hypothetical protein